VSAKISATVVDVPVFYLDTDVVIHLSKSKRDDVKPKDDYVKLGEDFVRCVESNLCRCVTSEEQLAELGMNGYEVQRAHQIGWLLHVTNRQILRPFPDLKESELQTGRPMRLSEALRSSEQASNFADQFCSPVYCDEMLPVWIGSKKDRVTDTKEMVADAVRRELELDDDNSFFQQPIGREFILECACAYFRPDPASELCDRTCPDWNGLILPCAWSSLFLANCRRWHGKRANRPTVDKGDFYDQRHYCYAAIAGHFVTRDENLLDAIGMIEWNQVPTVRLDCLEGEIAKLLDGARP
jgi:hypothetical protein